MNTDEFESPIENQEQPADATVEGEPATDDVEGHSLLVDPVVNRMLVQSHQDDIAREAEKHRREQEAKHPLQPRGRR